MSGITAIPYNAYRSWLEVAKCAQSQLIIFSPFFDEMVQHLFEECPLEWGKMGLVTQEDWDDYSSQSLRKKSVMNHLIFRGVDVRSLSRLHAKAIIADWDRAVIGSQNFTYGSQDNYEVSFRLEREADGADLEEVFECMYEWWELAGEESESDD